MLVYVMQFYVTQLLEYCILMTGLHNYYMDNCGDVCVEGVRGR